MRCARCGGLMVREQFEDHGGLGSSDHESDHEYAGWRCINCGAIVDPVITAHRRLTSQSAASNPALTTVQGNFLHAHFIYGELVAPRLSTASPAEVDGSLPTPRRGLSPQ